MWGGRAGGGRIREAKASCEIWLWSGNLCLKMCLCFCCVEAADPQGGGNLFDCKGGSGGLTFLWSVLSPVGYFCITKHVRCFCTRVPNFSMVQTTAFTHRAGGRSESPDLLSSAVSELHDSPQVMAANVYPGKQSWWGASCIFSCLLIWFSHRKCRTAHSGSPLSKNCCSASLHADNWKEPSGKNKSASKSTSLPGEETARHQSPFHECETRRGSRSPVEQNETGSSQVLAPGETSPVLHDCSGICSRFKWRTGLQELELWSQVCS